jgi:hypothetical protein
MDAAQKKALARSVILLITGGVSVHGSATHTCSLFCYIHELKRGCATCKRSELGCPDRCFPTQTLKFL